MSRQRQVRRQVLIYHAYFMPTNAPTPMYSGIPAIPDPFLCPNFGLFSAAPCCYWTTNLAIYILYKFELGQVFRICFADESRNGQPLCQFLVCKTIRIYITHNYSFSHCPTTLPSLECFPSPSPVSSPLDLRVN